MVRSQESGEKSEVAERNSGRNITGCFSLEKE
jgi:hypothetical protein